MPMPEQIVKLQEEVRVLRAGKAAYVALGGMFGGLFVVSLIFSLFVHSSFWTAAASFLVPLMVSLVWLHSFRVVLSK